MEENQTAVLDYQKGFNEGYTIAKHLPELAEQLAKASLEGPRGAGLKDGQKQFSFEKSKDRYPSWLTGDRTAKDEIEPDKSKDMDLDIDLEPER